MLNSFFPLEMGRRALTYFRQGMETAGHNISNAAVEGYSRQRVDVSATDPFTDPGLNRPGLPGQIGTGVGVDAVRRLRDLFLDTQYNQEGTTKGYWDKIADVLHTIELFVHEPNADLESPTEVAGAQGQGFKAAMDSFWSAVQEVEKMPDSAANRENLLQKAQTMTTLMKEMVANSEVFRASLNKELKLRVEEVNTLLDEVGALNRTIAEVENVGWNPNDLYDQRDLKVTRLYQLINCSLKCPCDPDDGDFRIYLDGRELVQGQEVRHLKLVPMEGNKSFFDIQVEDNEFDPVRDGEGVEVIIEQRAAEGIHTMEVARVASETRWKIGKGNPSTDTYVGRIEPPRGDENAALGISGSFRLSVGTSGVESRSRTLPGGVLLTAPPVGNQTKDYAFQVSYKDVSRVIQVKWDESGALATHHWTITDGTITHHAAAGSDLKLSDFASTGGTPGFFDKTSSFPALTVESTGGVLRLKSAEDHLLSLEDIRGDLLSGKLQMANPSSIPVTIAVTEEDSLATIRNKINGAFAATENAPRRPEEWLHAAVEQDGEGHTYLTLESHAVGEAYRINVLGDANGSFYMAKRLGLVDADVNPPHIPGGAHIMERAEDALFAFDGTKYLSATNTFQEARKLSSEDGYRAATLSTVSEGLRFRIDPTKWRRSEPPTTIDIQHHVKGGELRGYMEARDDRILSYLDYFDTLVYRFVTETNAVHYGGHGAGVNSLATGNALFDPLTGPSGAARTFGVSDVIMKNPSLLAAAIDDGRGRSRGEGDGANALRMAQLKHAKIMASGTSTFNEHYEAFVGRLGAETQRADSMSRNQKHLVEQIDLQRQSVMGVNIDEEMMDIVRFQQAFNAMARFITTTDEMLDRIINGLGTVGR